MVDFPGDPLLASKLAAFEGTVQRIVLTGFMGAGKTTVGQLLADRTGWKFVDLDFHIETTTGRRAQELFDALGETGFRQLETELWRSVLQLSQVILAPGGAVIDKPENQNLLVESGSFVIHLDAPFQTLIDRCLRQERKESATYRPLLHKIEAQARYTERRALYTKHAHRIFDVADKEPELVAQDIWQTVFATH